RVEFIKDDAGIRYEGDAVNEYAEANNMICDVSDRAWSIVGIEVYLAIVGSLDHSMD
ncbi:hypothetical protein Tco_0466963, partial [Tanacetum coccineum]